MSGIYIPGMRKPTSCWRCPIVDSEAFCPLIPDGTLYPDREGLLVDCPLVPVPEHGRSIDADKLLAEMYRSFVELEDKAEKELGFDEVLRRGMQWGHAVCVAAVHAAPAVIPADPAPRFDYPGRRDDDADL